MLNECKLALRVTAAAYEPELCSLMDAAAKDLEIAGVVLPGTVSFAQTEQGMQDNSTLTDALVMRAIFTYADWLFFKDAPNQDAKREIYNLQKVQLMHATGYTDYGEDQETEPDPGDGGDGE